MKIPCRTIPFSLHLPSAFFDVGGYSIICQSDKICFVTSENLSNECKHIPSYIIINMISKFHVFILFQAYGVDPYIKLIIRVSNLKLHIISCCASANCRNKHHVLCNFVLFLIQNLLSLVHKNNLQ